MPLVSFYNPQEYLETSGIKWVNNYRSSHLQLFFKVGVIKNFAIFTGKHVLSLFLISCEPATVRPATLLKRESSAGVFL